MQVKRTRLEIIDTEKRYYNNFDKTESGFNNFWKIFLILFSILILIILLITCYRCLYGQIIYMFKRCLTRRSKNNTENSFFIVKEAESDSCTKRRFLWLDTCNFSKFHMKYDGQRNKQYENKCKLKNLLQEKKKLLAPRDNKTVTSTNNVDLTKQLSLKMSFSTFSSVRAKYKDVPKSISNKWNAKSLENYKYDKLSAENIKNLCQNSYKNDKDICFSDTDLKFLVIPKKSDIKDELLLLKWNSGSIINNSKTNNTSSKLIELKFENTDSFSDNTQKYRNYSPYSLLSKNLTTDSKYFSDSAANRSDILPHVFLSKRRSTISYTSSTLSSVSNTVKIRNNKMLHRNSKTEDTSTYTIANDNIIKIDDLNQLKSQINLNKCNLCPRKMRSSIDILTNQIKDVNNCGKKSKSDENFVNSSSIQNDNSKNFTTEQIFVSTSEKLICNNENIFVPSDHKSEISETYDELGILFSQYVKLQTRPCQRKYCPLKRNLKQRLRHSTKKCQMKFNYQIYPYDQRPTCNSGNICTDTYDELKLMRTSPTERKGIYQCMFKRRKHFLNQPCIVSDQNFTTAK